MHSPVWYFTLAGIYSAMELVTFFCDIYHEMSIKEMDGYAL